MKKSLMLMTTTASLMVLAGCLSSEDYRAEAGEELCGWIYGCSQRSVVAPLEETYEFYDEEGCVEWFFEQGHYTFDGEWVVWKVEDYDECDFDRDAAHDYLDLLESLSCGDLDVRSFVELGEDTFGQPYRDCWAMGGGS